MNTTNTTTRHPDRQAARQAAKAALELFRYGHCKQASAIWRNAMEAFQ